MPFRATLGFPRGAVVHMAHEYKVCLGPRVWSLGRCHEFHRGRVCGLISDVSPDWNRRSRPVLRAPLYNHALIPSISIFGHLPDHLLQPCNQLPFIRSARVDSKCNPLLSSGNLLLEESTNHLTAES